MKGMIPMNKTPMNKIVYHVETSYIDTSKELIPEHYIMSYEANYKVTNVKELKKIMIDLVDDNIAENREWINDNVLPLVSMFDKTHIHYNACNPVKYYCA